jgi:geranylgeranyl diphosphate synthase type I
VADPVTAEVRETVGSALDEFIDAKREQLAVVGDDLTPLVELARSAVGGGKRLRPAFAYWGWRAAGGNPAKARSMLVAAAAIELVHASALVHDDVMDDSATRRGAPAAHRRLRELRLPAADERQAARFGRSGAILLGDLLLSWSDELLCSSGLRPKQLARARVYFDRLRTEVVAGQYLDVLAQTGRNSTAADAMRVIRYKSAKYTIERPLQFGAAIGNADQRLLTALSTYGIPLGEAFQLRDDVLGVFGQEGLTGKPTGDDIREGKRTLLIARAIAKATPQQAEVLRRQLGRPDVDAAGIGAVQLVLRDSGALAAVETVISELTAASLHALRHAPIESAEVREALRLMTDRVTNRSV